jgi:hypothetical protein
MAVISTNVKVQQSILGMNAGVLGSLSLALDRFIFQQEMVSSRQTL